MGKLNPTRLAGIVSRLPKTDSPDLIVGIETVDDAGVFRLTDDLALVQTLDFFYPIVNDPRSFGRIVAANALSDIWAMGGRARTALNILAYPAGKIPVDAVEALLAGGSEKLVEAPNPVGLLAARGDQDDRHIAGFGLAAQAPTDFQAGQTWEHPIQKDQAGDRFFHLQQRFLAVPGIINIESCLAQVVTEHGHKGGFVLDD